MKCLPAVIETEEQNERMLREVEHLKSKAKALADFFHVSAELFI
jgi:hypothetical protein